ncbi:MAG: hypothetical protein LQ345_005221 [Seirophora villosa]|nr:MAG: hypothetical protein LQ345_005221 [Seirophora villosa]
MSPHNQTSLLLLQKTLKFHPSTSPFTLVLDSVEQSAAGFVKECVAGVKGDIIYISYTSNKTPPSNIDMDIDTFIPARRKTPEALKREIISACSSSSSTKQTNEQTIAGRRTLLIISPVTTLLTRHPTLNISSYLLSLLSPTTSLLGIHHQDIPLPTAAADAPSSSSPYHPSPQTLLTYLATTILTLHAFPQALARKTASDRSAREPLFGLAENRPGVIAGMGGNAYARAGMVLEMEHRRKSGRAVRATFFMPPPAPDAAGFGGGVRLLEEHPLFGAPDVGGEKEGKGEEGEGEEGGGGTTFELGLTEKQREAREGVVLPYFDAQKKEGGGEGGRILYQMGTEDDFDEEEDEI